MSERTLQELSEASKAHFEAREWQLATNCLLEARERFPQEGGARLVQAEDGSIAVESEAKDVHGIERTVRGNVTTIVTTG